jgi:hypothetical protein
MSNQKQVLAGEVSQKAVFDGPKRDLEIDFSRVFDGSLHSSHLSLSPVHLYLYRSPEQKVEVTLPTVSRQMKGRPLILFEHAPALCLEAHLGYPVDHKGASVLFQVVMMAYGHL